MKPWELDIKPLYRFIPESFCMSAINKSVHHIFIGIKAHLAGLKV
jgi:hypothetical protein